jgi:hypothetical protein
MESGRRNALSVATAGMMCAVKVHNEHPAQHAAEHLVLSLAR